MKDLEVGQVLALRIRMEYCGLFKDKHPYLILAIHDDDNTVEVGQLHSMEGKMFEIIARSNKAIFQGMPDETVIDKDSFVQLDNTILLEYYEDLSNFRRQKDKLSSRKLASVVAAYEEYHRKNRIEESHTVYLEEIEITELNS